MADTAMPPSSVVMAPSGWALQTPSVHGTIHTSDVPMSSLPQATPSVAGSTGGLAATPLITHVAMPLTPMPHVVAMPFMTHGPCRS